MRLKSATVTSLNESGTMIVDNNKISNAMINYFLW